MQFVCIDATWENEIKLGNEVLEYFKENKVKTVALFASVNFLKLDTVKKQLKNFKILTTKAKRTHVESQILGCDAYHDSFEKNIIGEADTILYVGDGLFHPKALLLSQKKVKPVVIWDPVNEKMNIITEEDIKKQLLKAKGNFTRYLAAETIGILVSTKPGQQYFNRAKELKEKLEKEGKKAYIFIDNTLQINLLENYPFIDAWVNTSCPRIGTDDITTIPQPLINIKEAFDNPTFK